jgi:hypothetical protein
LTTIPASRSGTSWARDPFLACEQAEAALAEVLADEPTLTPSLSVVELPLPDASLN